jgi:glycosyltransferase involved in cell wall biosynthesis
MKVLYLTANPNLGSTTSSLNAILSGLRPRGLEPAIVFTRPGPWQEEMAAAGVPTYFDPLRWPARERPLSSLANAWRLARVVLQERADIIHCNEHEHFPCVRQVGRMLGVPVVVTLHWNLMDGYGQWAFAPPYTPAAIQFLSRRQMELSIPNLPANLPAGRVQLLMSGLAIDDLLSRGDDGRALRASWGAGPGTVVLGMASALKPRKHLELFVRLIGRLRARGLDVLGVIAGGGAYVDPEYLAGVKQEIADAGLEAHCRFAGFVSPITTFFRACDISINTSEMEILCMSMCEAQACGRPTLAFDVGGNAETVPSPWCVVPFGDLDALEQRAATLVGDARERERLGHEARDFVRREFDAPVLARRQAAVYEHVLGRPLERVV